MYSIVGERIKDERIKRKWTGKEVCAKLWEKEQYSISTGKYSTMESNDDKDFGYRVFIHLARLFGVSTDYLLGMSDIASIEEDIIIACKTTGLSELTIKHLQEVSTSNNHQSYFGIMDALISLIDVDLLFHIRLLSILQLKQTVFERELLKQFCSMNNINVSNDLIETVGTSCLSPEERMVFDNFKQRSLKRCSKIDSNINKDINYEKFIISNKIHEMITSFLGFVIEQRQYKDFKKQLGEYYHDTLLLLQNESELNDYILQHKNSVDMFSFFDIREEEKNG